MDTMTRLRRIRLLDKMEQNPLYSDKLGLRNKSVFYTENKKGKRC